MSTYAELKAQADALNAQAELARQTERMAAIAKCREFITEFDLAMSELGFKAGKQAKEKRKQSAGTFAVAKYKGPNGELWAGGKGRKPNWLKALTESGGNPEEYRIKPE